MSQNAAWERRRRQEQKDDRERRTPVYGPSMGMVYALRPIFDRMLRRAAEDHTKHVVDALSECECGRDLADVRARRAKKKANRAAARRRRFYRPISRRNAARAAR